MTPIIDHFGKSFLPFGSLVRIVSLVPSITELLVDLDLSTNLVGRTKFCVFPPSIKKSVQACGGTKNPNRSKILEIHPDIVLMNLEENNKDDAQFFESKGISVFTTCIKNRSDNYELIRSMGRLFDRSKQAQFIENQLFLNSEKYVLPRKGKAIYLIWKDPYMTVGGDTFIHDMMDWAGYENAYNKSKRYPIVVPSELDFDVDWLLLSSEPFPFSEKHIDQIELDFGIARNRIKLVDGTYFSWYGSRMVHSPAYFSTL